MRIGLVGAGLFGMVVTSVVAVAPSGASSSVVTGGASSVTGTSAVVSGTGTLSGSALYVFEYSTSSEFSNETSQYVDASSVVGSSDGAVLAQLGGLSPGTTYYYRLVGIQGSTSTDGDSQSFTTAQPPSSTTTTTTTTTPSSPPGSSTTTTTTAPGGGSSGNGQPKGAPGSSSSGSGGGSGSSVGSAEGSGEVPTPVIPTADGQGYWLVTSAGVVVPYGDAASLGDLSGDPPSSPVVGLTATPTGDGYWMVTSEGSVFAFGDAQSYGPLVPAAIGGPVVSLTATPDGKGYWILVADGTVYAFGDAKYFGSAAGVVLPALVMGMTPTPDGQGYWLVLTNGAVLNFGDAAYFGSAGGFPMAKAVVGIASTPDGQGYWEVSADGTVYGFGDAKSYGSAGLANAPQNVVAITPTADGKGYWLTASDGNVYTYGDAVSYPAALGAVVRDQGIVGLAQPVLHTLAGVPLEYVVLDEEAAGTCPGLPWEILTAIAKVESDFGTSTLPGVRSGTNSAGAAGPMQMGIEGAAGHTFQAYDHPTSSDKSATPVPPGSDPPSPYNPADEIFAAARDLCENGGKSPETLNAALLAYNHAQWYANEVETLAAGYAGSTTFSLGTSPAMSTAVRLALSQIGVPYRWGGSTPGVGFDCSGLVQWAYGLAGISLPRTTYAQWAVVPHLPPGAPLEVGDLLFFEPSPDGPGHVGIYIGGGLMVDAPHTGASVRIEAYDWPSYVGAALP